MEEEQSEKDEFYMLFILFWPIWVPVTFGVLYIVF